MKTKQLLFFLILLTSYASKAQEKALAKVHYKFYHINDANNREQPLRDEVVTYLGKVSSYYTTYSNEIIKADIAAQKALADFNGHMVINFKTTAIKEFYLLNTDIKRISKIEAISDPFDAYTYDVLWEEQDWQVLDETKEIGGYSCQKAITTYKGRRYEAWFTTELPFPFGPWRLHGLPGLILEAEDDKGEVRFEYNGFDKTQDDRKIEIPYYVIKSNPSEIEKVREVFNTDQAKYFQTLQSSGRMKLATDFFDIDYSKHRFDIKTDDDYKPSSNTNNPIELTK
jgi:GLPGLI family protein